MGSLSSPPHTCIKSYILDEYFNNFNLSECLGVSNFKHHLSPIVQFFPNGIVHLWDGVCVLGGGGGGERLSRAVYLTPTCIDKVETSMPISLMPTYLYDFVCQL